eukprot:359517-Chlamydomonas_euryale.AAC.38
MVSWELGKGLCGPDVLGNWGKGRGVGSDHSLCGLESAHLCCASPHLPVNCHVGLCFPPTANCPANCHVGLRCPPTQRIAQRIVTSVSAVLPHIELSSEASPQSPLSSHTAHSPVDRHLGLCNCPTPFVFQQSNQPCRRLERLS